MTQFQKPKIIVPDYNNEASYTIDFDGYYFKTGYGIISKSDQYDLYYLLGLLNSKLLFWCLKRISTSLRGGYIRFWTKYIEQLPIKTIIKSSNEDKEKHNKIVEFVKQILDAKIKISNAKTEDESNRLELLCSSLDRKIDETVYELYGLTEEEIKIVEGDNV